MNGHFNSNNGYQAGPPSRPPGGQNQFPLNTHPGQRFPPNDAMNQFNPRPPLPPQQYPRPGSNVDPGPAPFANDSHNFGSHNTEPPARYAEGRGRGAFGKIAAETSLRDQERARMAPRPQPPPMRPPHPHQQQYQQQQGHQQTQAQQYPPDYGPGHGQAYGSGAVPPRPSNSYAHPPAQPPYHANSNSIPTDRYLNDRPPPPPPASSSSSQQYPPYPPGPPFQAPSQSYPSPSPGIGGSNGFEPYGRDGFDYARSEGGRSSGRNERGLEGRDPSLRAGPAVPPGGRRNDRENADRNKLIDERISKEKPCRTLFVRNVAFEADVRALEQTFRSYGDIKRFYEMVKNRGMIFVTYFDTRAAAAARDAQHGTLVLGRPIDVHYSLPQEEETTGRADREKNNGTLMLTLKGGRALNRAEVGRTFEKFGDIKELRDVLALETKVVEYYDARAAIEAYDAMNNKPFQDSTLTVRFVWDDPEITRRDKKGGDRGDRADRGDTRDGDRDRRRVSDFRDHDRARDRERDGGRARSPERTYRRDSHGDRGPQSQPDEAEKFRKAKEIERLLNGIGNVQPQAPTLAQPTARPPPTLQNFRPPPHGSQQGYNNNSTAYNAGPAPSGHGVVPTSAQGQVAMPFRPNGAPPPPPSSSMYSAPAPSIPIGQGTIRPPYMSPPNLVGQQGPPTSAPTTSYGGNQPNLPQSMLLSHPPAPAPATPSIPVPSLSADLLAMLAGAAPPAPSPAAQTYLPTPVPAAAVPAPPKSTESASGSTASPTGGNDQTAAMTKLLALLVAQQQKT